MSLDLRYLALFGLLYFAQGSLAAYTVFFHKPYLSDMGIGPDRIGWLAGLMGLPFIIKVLLGFVSDRFSLLGLGHRIPYLVLGLTLTGGTLLGLSRVSPRTDFSLFSALLLLAVFSVALADATTDAIAVEVTPPERQEAVQTVMTSGRALGLMVSSALFGRIASGGHTASLFLVASGVTLLPLALLPALGRGGAPRTVRRFEWQALRAFGDGRVLRFAAFAFLLSAVLTSLLGLVTFFLRANLHATPAQIGSFGTLTSVGLVAGSWTLAVLRARFGLAPVVRATVLVMAAYTAILATMSAPRGLPLLALVNGTIWGLLVTAALGMSMRRTQPLIAGTMFAALMACFNVGGDLGESVFTSLVDDLGFRGVFLVLACLALLILPMLQLTLDETELGRTAAAPPGDPAASSTRSAR